MEANNFSNSRDIQPKAFPDVDWSAGKRAASLIALRNYVIKEAEQAFAWYDRKRLAKRRVAWLLRMFAILLTGAAGLIPLLGKYSETDGKPGIDPILSGIFVGVAGIMIVLDRFYGFSSAWVRYMKASQQLGRTLRGFHLEFARTKLGWDAPDPTTQQTEACLVLCKNTVAEVDAIVQRETDEWIVEFQTALAQIDAATKEVAQHKPPGAITLEVTNGDQCPNGWEVSVDGGTKHHCTGKHFAIRDVTAGIHNVSVVGDLGQGATQSTKAVEVKDGEIVAIQFTL